MDIRPFLVPVPATTTLGQIQRSQLMWMLFFRVLLYTSILLFTYFFRNAQQQIILIPHHQLILLLLAVYTISIASAFFLLSIRRNFIAFALTQNLFDTFFAAFLLYATGSSQSIFTSVFFFSIVSGGLILPRFGGIAAATSSMLALGVLVYIEFAGHFPAHLLREGILPQGNSLALVNTFSLSSLTFFLAAILSALLGARITKTESALTDSLKSFDQLAGLYKQIFDNISTGIITIDAEQNITSVNNAALSIIGYRHEQLFGKSIREMLPPLDTSARGIRRTAAFIRPDGKNILLGYSVMFFHQPEDKSVPLSNLHNQIITLQDISEVEQLERQIRQSEKLAAIGMMSASIAHDFRNPLTAISGSAQVLASELLASEGGDSTNYELSTIIIREADRMIRTIAEFLKFSRPENAEPNWFSLQKCVAEVIQVCTANPQWPKSAIITTNIAQGLDIWADQKQIFTVLSHFVTNAIVFCPPGAEQIHITAEELPHSPDVDAVCLSVEDNGCGIAENLWEKVFEPFYTSRADGTGLGLAIVKQIVDGHGGKIKVGASRSGGTLFAIFLPLPS